MLLVTVQFLKLRKRATDGFDRAGRLFFGMDADESGGCGKTDILPQMSSFINRDLLGIDVNRNCGSRAPNMSMRLIGRFLRAAPGRDRLGVGERAGVDRIDEIRLAI